MSHKTDFKCEDCGSKSLLLPKWETQDEDGFTTYRQDCPDAYLLNGDAWCNDCEKIIFVDTQ